MVAPTACWTAAWKDAKWVVLRVWTKVGWKAKMRAAVKGLRLAVQMVSKLVAA